MILNAGNGKFIGGLLFMASLMYGFLPNGRDKTVFYIIKLSCCNKYKYNILFY